MAYYFPSSADDPDAIEGSDALDEEPEDRFEYLDLEHNELDRRLRNLSWPAPPAEVRERILQAVLDGRSLRCPLPPPVNPEPPRGRNRVASERVQRYELSRRRIEVVTERVWTAPRREPRFAAHAAGRRQPRFAAVL